MSADWKVALSVYLVVGSLILLVILVHHRLTTTRKSNWVKAALAASDPRRQTLRYRALSDFAAPAFASLFIWALWPIGLAMVVKWKREAQREERNLKEEREAKAEQSRQIAMQSHTWLVRMTELIQLIRLHYLD
jgi:hypothetical protein